MQSSLAVRTLRSYMAAAVTRNQAPLRGLSSSSSSGPADPAVHSGDLEGEDAEEAAKAASARPDREHKPTTENTEPLPFVSTAKPRYNTKQKLETTGVNQPLDPNIQQKRSNSTVASLEDVSCVGVDGRPLPTDGDSRKEQEEEEAADNKAYFEHHKASPLSEIEVADTRKPITAATDGTANAGYFGGDYGVVLWKEEQLDTAEEALLRASSLWREAATRGVPDYPHSRVLRALRGE